MIKLADGRGHLYQWDMGRQVECDAEQVHFSNHHYGTSIDVDVKDGRATIPNQLLTSAIPLKAWAWVKDSNGEYTKEEQIFLVAKRNKPSDYVYTPTEIKTWQDLQNQLGNLSNLKTEHKDNLVNAINDAAGIGGGASTAEDVSYTNAALPNVENVKTALDELVPKSHTHDNKDMLDKLSDSNGKLQYNGSDVGLKGDKGDTGATGAPGLKGDTGADGKDGVNGITPTIGANGNWYLGTTDTGKPSRGENGVTPHIGDNGNWYIGNTDTGKPSRGVAGARGDTGATGTDGKTPVKGTDYWTKSDKQEIVNDVIAALPDGTEVSY